MQRRRFTPEFKREAVKLGRQPGAVISKIAEELGLNAKLLRRWIQQFEQGRWESKPGAPLKTQQQAEIERLRKENAKLRTERDILNKSGGLLREGTPVKYGFVLRHRALWSVGTMCRMLQVSRSGFYEWRSRSLASGFWGTNGLRG